MIEFDVDPAIESGRGDYYIGVFQKEEFDSASWVDAFSQGGYESYEDVNDDVGGANPTTSDFGGSPGDGYDTALSQGSDRVWGRIVGGNFQVAVRRTLVGDPAVAALRPWSRQSTSLSKDKLYFHDQNPIADVAQIDNLSGVGLGWIPVRPPQPDLLVLKLVQVIQDPFNGTTNPKAIPGAIAMYTLQVTNTGPGTVDTDSLMVTDPIPSEVALVISDFDVVNPGPAAFVDGTPSSALSYTFISLGSSTDDIEFSSDGGSTWAYTPVDSGNGTDPAVTNVRINPKGTMAAGGSPSFQLFFKVRVP